MQTFLLEYRCSCGYLLFKGLILDARLEVKCKRCGKVQLLSQHPARVSNNQYALVFNNLGKIVDASASASTILGYSLDELKALSIPQLAPHATQQDFNHVWQSAEKMNFESMTMESFSKTKDGKFLVLRSRVSYPLIKENRFALVISEIIDRDENFLFHPDLLTDKIVVQNMRAETNTRGFFTNVSNDFALQLGYTIFEMVGKSLFDFIPKEESSIFRYEFGLMVEGRQSFFVKKNTFVTKSGKTVQYDTNYSAVFFEDNEMRGFKLTCIVI